MSVQAIEAVFLDANPTLAAGFERLRVAGDLSIRINRQVDIVAAQIPTIVGDAQVVVIDHTALPTDIARQCKSLRHVVFLGTGARSYMVPEELATLGIEVHTIKGYGDTAVAECAFALMWAGAKGIARMDRGMRDGQWLRTEGLQVTGKTLGLVGFGGIAAELARLATSIGMRVLAWNRTYRSAPGVEFVTLDQLLAESDVVSLHLLLNDDTRGFLSAIRLAQMKRGAMLINTARGALVDEAAMIEALISGQLGHAGLDVFVVEPMQPGHPLTLLDNVTLSAHSAFRTPEANDNLVNAALAHCRRIVSSSAASAA
ncbi:NAD(P)-dependent oxidoreductase [soil metagenome]